MTNDYIFFWKVKSANLNCKSTVNKIENEIESSNVDTISLQKPGSQ